jgi:hypothetical protein
VEIINSSQEEESSGADDRSMIYFGICDTLILGAVWVSGASALRAIIIVAAAVGRALRRRERVGDAGR